MLDLNLSLTGQITALIDAQMEAENQKQASRDYLGPSALGYECERSIQYGYIGLQKDDGRGFKGRILRVFKAGHHLENVTIDELRSIGWKIVNEKADGSGQIGFSTAKGKFRGHCDGVITFADGMIDVPALFEHKALGEKTFKGCVKNGIKETTPYYYSQVQVYMAYLDLTANPCLFACRNRADETYYFELIPFDAAEAQRISDRAVRIIQATEAGETLPRCTKDQTSFKCRWCDYQQRCWMGSDLNVGKLTEKPGWVK